MNFADGRFWWRYFKSMSFSSSCSVVKFLATFELYRDLNFRKSVDSDSESDSDSSPVDSDSSLVDSNSDSDLKDSDSDSDSDLVDSTTSLVNSEDLSQSAR